MKRQRKGRTRDVSVLPSTGHRPTDHVQPMAALHPRRIEQLRALNRLPLCQEVGIFHDEHAVVPELVFERLKRVMPFGRPLLGPVRPATSPLGGAPRIADLQETLSAKLDGFDDRVRMICGTKSGSQILADL